MFRKGYEQSFTDEFFTITERVARDPSVYRLSDCCVNIADESKRIPTLTFDKPHYTQLSKSHIDDIEISLKNDQNEHIPFTYGKVIVKLHFRPVKQYF